MRKDEEGWCCRGCMLIGPRTPLSAGAPARAQGRLPSSKEDEPLCGGQATIQALLDHEAVPRALSRSQPLRAPSLGRTTAGCGFLDHSPGIRSNRRGFLFVIRDTHPLRKQRLGTCYSTSALAYLCSEAKGTDAWHSRCDLDQAKARMQP